MQISNICARILGLVVCQHSYMYAHWLVQTRSVETRSRSPTPRANPGRCASHHQSPRSAGSMCTSNIFLGEDPVPGNPDCSVNMPSHLLRLVVQRVVYCRGNAPIPHPGRLQSAIRRCTERGLALEGLHANKQKCRLEFQRELKSPSHSELCRCRIFLHTHHCCATSVKIRSLRRTESK